MDASSHLSCAQSQSLRRHDTSSWSSPAAKYGTPDTWVSACFGGGRCVIGEAGGEFEAQSALEGEVGRGVGATESNLERYLCAGL